MSTQAPDKERVTPAQKALLRTGKCVALTCAAGCLQFEFDIKADGFRQCTCGHTQHAHSNGGAVLVEVR